MDAKEAIRKYWWVGAILLAVVVLFRGRSTGGGTTARLAAVEAQTPTGDGIMEQTLQRLAGEEASRASRLQEAQTALALQQIDAQKKLISGQADYELSILKGQTLVQQRLTEKASRVKFACQDGTTKLDPATGQLYCRQERTKGMSIGGQSIFGSGGVLNSLNSLIGKFIPGLPTGSVFGGGYGTPPIVGSTPPFIPRPGGGPF